jgi:hypothetical protein
LATVCLRYFNVFGPRQDPKRVRGGVCFRGQSLEGLGETIRLAGTDERG